MKRRTRKTAVVVATVLAAAGLAGGGVALAADGDEAPREKVRFVVEEGSADSGATAWTREDCPDKDGSGDTPSGAPSEAAPSEGTDNPSEAL